MLNYVTESVKSNFSPRSIIYDSELRSDKELTITINEIQQRVAEPIPQELSGNRK